MKSKISISKATYKIKVSFLQIDFETEKNKNQFHFVINIHLVVSENNLTELWKNSLQ